MESFRLSFSMRQERQTTTYGPDMDLCLFLYCLYQLELSFVFLKHLKERKGIRKMMQRCGYPTNKAGRFTLSPLNDALPSSVPGQPFPLNLSLSCTVTFYFKFSPGSSKTLTWKEKPTLVFSLQESLGSRFYGSRAIQSVDPRTHSLPAVWNCHLFKAGFPSLSCWKVSGRTEVFATASIFPRNRG